jgi:hypothetical protein
MTQIFGQQLPILSHVEQFEIYESHWECGERPDVPDVDSSQWLELFHLFNFVQGLYVSKRFLPLVAAALQELTAERAMEVLPALRSLSLQELQPFGSVQEAIKSFVAIRQLSDNPVVIQNWELE